MNQQCGVLNVHNFILELYFCSDVIKEREKNVREVERSIITTNRADCTSL